MTGDDGLAVVLTATAHALEGDLAEARRGVALAQEDGVKLDDLVSRAGDLTAVSQKHQDSVAEVRARLSPLRAAPGTVEWSQLQADATKRLVDRGVDLTRVDLDALLDPHEVSRIEQRFLGGFEIRADLDRYDVCVAAAAGLIAAMVDFLVVRIPQDTAFRNAGLRDQFRDKGSPLTKWLQKDPMPHDNPLGRICKVSFDRVSLKETGRGLPGSGGRTHRYHTLGHDPLLGLLFGTLDIMRGGLTGIDRHGNFVSIPTFAPGESNPFLALLIEIAHLLSDADTRMGLPAPGWTLTGMLQWGDLGPHDETLAQTARKMYVAGYDSRHFLTMASSPAVAELVLRGYWGVRRVLDAEFDDDVTHAGHVARTDKVGDHPRFQAMALVAHLIASAANAGKVAAYQNPLALNYAQWLAFIKALISFSTTRLRSPSDVLAGHAEANIAALAAGWPTVDWTDDSPVLLA